MGFQEKQFCLRGHDIVIVGRFRNNKACKRCAYERNRSINEKRRGAPAQPRVQKEKVVSTPESRSNRRLKEKYGITLADKKNMLVAQNNMCANKACSIQLSTISSACVDHCHITGKVRGILCSLCNSAIGHAKESIEVLKGCIAYLESR